MNLLDLTRRLYRETGKSGDGPTTLVSATKDVLRLADRIGDANMRLEQEPRNWKWMRAKVVGDAVPLQFAQTGASLGAANFGRWRTPARDYTVRAYDPANTPAVWPLRWMEYDQFVGLMMDVPTTPTMPQVWSISPNEELLLGPAPDIAYKVMADYIFEPGLLTLDDDTPAMPARHHMILVWRALVDSGKDIAAAEKVSRAMDNLAEMENNLISDQAEQIVIGGYPLA